MLKELGCDEAQGFLISPAVGAREAFALAGTVFPIGEQSADAEPVETGALTPSIASN